MLKVDLPELPKAELKLMRETYRLCYDIVIVKEKVPTSISDKALLVMSLILVKLEKTFFVDHGPEVDCPHAGKHHFLLCRLIERQERE